MVTLSLCQVCQVLHLCNVYAFLESRILRVRCYDTEHYEVRFYHFNLSGAFLLKITSNFT